MRRAMSAVLQKSSQARRTSFNFHNLQSIGAKTKDRHDIFLVAAFLFLSSLMALTGVGYVHVKPLSECYRWLGETVDQLSRLPTLYFDDSAATAYEKLL